MPLPKIDAITTDVKIPSTGTEIKIRQMLTKDEKIILSAKADTGDEAEKSVLLLKAICQVVQNCIVTPGIDVEKLALFDVEYLFIKLRETSVSNIVESPYRDIEEWDEYVAQLKQYNNNLELFKRKELRDDTGELVTKAPVKPKEPEPYIFKIDLSKVVVKFPEASKDKKVESGNITINLKYPDASLYYNPVFLLSQGIQTLDQLVLNAISGVTQGSQQWKMADVKAEEIMEFLNDMPIKVYDRVKDFLSNLPYVFYEIKYKNKLGNERTITLNALRDFFQF